MLYIQIISQNTINCIIKKLPKKFENFSRHEGRTKRKISFTEDIFCSFISSQTVFARIPVDVNVFTQSYKIPVRLFARIRLRKIQCSDRTLFH